MWRLKKILQLIVRYNTEDGRMWWMSHASQQQFFHRTDPTASHILISKLAAESCDSFKMLS
jgi:hypothetical protein